MRYLEALLCLHREAQSQYCGFFVLDSIPMYHYRIEIHPSCVTDISEHMQKSIASRPVRDQIEESISTLFFGLTEGCCAPMRL